MNIILASQSPRRRELLETITKDFEIIVSNADETLEVGMDVEEQVENLAYTKAKTVFDKTQSNRIVIGADTIVVKDDTIYGKPASRADAIRMLKSLQGNIHTVYTSIAILIENGGEFSEYEEVVKTDIMVHSMSDEEIENYIDTEEPFDKAGSYAIQSSFCKYIDDIDGNYMSVIGLPIDRVYQILKENDAI